MAKKKIEKYVPVTKFPAENFRWKVLEKNEKYDNLDTVLELNKQALEKSGQTWDRLHYFKEGIKSGRFSDEELKNWKATVGVWHYRATLNQIYVLTPEFDAVNDAFMKEFDSREDLQEIYAETFDNHYGVYDRHGNSYNKEKAIELGYDKRPESYVMYDNVVSSHQASKKIELARETPYMEGDLLLLRTPYVGRRNIDPMYVHPYSTEYYGGARTPDKSVPRIATLIAIKDEVAHYRATRGSKIMQIIWIGSDQLVNLEEKYLKWHERPTYKNGLKTRPE